jgi:tetratricopeptide (TPR) repeat protein
VRNPMKPLALLLAVLACASAADVPEPALIVTADGREIAGSVVSETVDGVEYTLGDGASAAVSKIDRAKLKAVTYQNDINDIDFQRGRGALTKKEYEKAAASFLAAATGGASFRVREEGYVAAADAYRQLKRHDDALKALAELEAKAPRSTRLPAAHNVRVAILIEKGDRAGAVAEIAVLAKVAPVRAAVARADLARADKKPADAAKELAAAWETAPRSAPEGEPTYDSIGFQLAADLLASQAAGEANAVFAKLCYGATTGNGRARAHLALARALSTATAKADLLSALDHALMGGAISGGDKASAKRIGQEILAALDKDAAMAKEVSEYRAYLNAL